MPVFRPRCRVLLSTVFDGGGASNSSPLTVEVQPTDVTVSRNGYHDADTFSLTCDWSRLPFDPNLIASMEARVYMWDEEDGTEVWSAPEREMIRGLVDEPEGSTEENTLSLSGRDYTGVMDPEWDPKTKVPSGQPLDVTVKKIADGAAPANTAARFDVLWLATDDHGRPIKPPQVGAAMRSTKQKGLWVKPGKTYWEVIYDLCIQHGFIVYIRVIDGRPTIVINSARTETKETLAQAPTLVYGVHLADLTASRRLARNAVPQISIVGWDPVRRKRVEVKYPSSKRDVITALKVEKNTVERYPAPRGIYDVDTLTRYAKLRHVLMSRAEAVYKLRTRFLRIERDDHRSGRAPDGHTYTTTRQRTEADLLRLQAGDPIAVAFDPFNGENFRRLDEGQRLTHLIAMGFAEPVAAFVAANYQQLDQYRQPFYVQQAEYRWSAEDGLEIEITAANYAFEQRERQFVTPASDVSNAL